MVKFTIFMLFMIASLNKVTLYLLLCLIFLFTQIFSLIMGHFSKQVLTIGFIISFIVMEVSERAVYLWIRVFLILFRANFSIFQDLSLDK